MTRRRPSTRRPPVSARAGSTPRRATRPAATAPTARSARAPRRASDRAGPPPGGTMKLTANGIDINYEIEGEGPVVTFSHSLGCDLSMWDEQVRALRPRYRVLRYDTRGHGRTSA